VLAASIPRTEIHAAVQPVGLIGRDCACAKNTTMSLKELKFNVKFKHPGGGAVADWLPPGRMAHQLGMGTKAQFEGQDNLEANRDIFIFQEGAMMVLGKMLATVLPHANHRPKKVSDLYRASAGYRCGAARNRVKYRATAETGGDPSIYILIKSALASG